MFHVISIVCTKNGHVVRVTWKLREQSARTRILKSTARPSGFISRQREAVFRTREWDSRLVSRGVMITVLRQTFARFPIGESVWENLGESLSARRALFAFSSGTFADTPARFRSTELSANPNAMSLWRPDVVALVAVLVAAGACNCGA